MKATLLDDLLIMKVQSLTLNIVVIVQYQQGSLNLKEAVIDISPV